jgi:hypothetical protein
MPSTATKPPPNSLYERDFYAWTQEQAQLLRERRWHDIDVENLVEEVAGVGRSDKREIESRLDVLIAHLLKWKYQPGARSSGWTGTIAEQRRRLERVLQDSPSLKPFVTEVFEDCYLAGRLRASQESGIDFTVFPDRAPFAVEQVLDEGFLPKNPDLLDPA